MNIYYIISYVIVILIVLLVFYMVSQKIQLRKRSRFVVRWHELQKLCVNPSNWNRVIVESDKLVADVLKQEHFKGKNVGEKIVSAQRVLTDNDAIWFCHKLANQINDKIISVDDKKLLIKVINGYRQALVDLMILKTDTSKK